MGFNYGKERYRTETEFARFAKTCREAGMPEDAIAEMYQYDREALNSDRRYYTHTQPFDGAAFSVEMTKSARKAGRPSIKTAWRSAASGWKSAIPGATAGWRTLIPRRLSSGSKPSLMTTSNCSPQSCLTAGTKARSPASGIALRPLSPSG